MSGPERAGKSSDCRADGRRTLWLLRSGATGPRRGQGSWTHCRDRWLFLTHQRRRMTSEAVPVKFPTFMPEDPLFAPLLPGLLERPPDADGISIDVDPPEPAKFAASATGQHCQGQQRPPVGCAVLGCGQQPPDLIGGRNLVSTPGAPPVQVPGAGTVLQGCARQGCARSTPNGSPGRERPTAPRAAGGCWWLATDEPDPRRWRASGRDRRGAGPSGPGGGHPRGLGRWPPLPTAGPRAGLRSPLSGFGAGQPFQHWGSDGGGGTRGLDGGHLVPEAVQRLAGLGLVLRLHGPGHLAGIAGHRIGAVEDPEPVAASVEPLDRSCTLGPSPLTDPDLFRSNRERNMGWREAEAARRGARAAESDSLLMS